MCFCSDLQGSSALECCCESEAQPVKHVVNVLVNSFTGISFCRQVLGECRGACSRGVSRASEVSLALLNLASKMAEHLREDQELAQEAYLIDIYRII